MSRTDRRGEARRAVVGVWQDGCLRLRTGLALRLLNASSRGVLIEGHTRLQPGRRLEVHVVTRSGRQPVWCRVAWVRVSRVRPDHVEYLAGLAFEQVVDGAWREYELPLREARSG